MPLLFQIFAKTAFVYHHERMKRGCYHVTFNVSGIWRHTFLDSFVPLLPPLKDHDVIGVPLSLKTQTETSNEPIAENAQTTTSVNIPQQKEDIVVLVVVETTTKNLSTKHLFEKFKI
jgi:hypothetical protein